MGKQQIRLTLVGLVEFVMGEEINYLRRSLLRQGPRDLEGTGGKGIGAVGQHLLSVVVGQGGSLDAQVAQHGI